MRGVEDHLDRISQLYEQERQLICGRGETRALFVALAAFLAPIVVGSLFVTGLFLFCSCW